MALESNAKLCQAYLAEPKSQRQPLYRLEAFKKIGAMLFEFLNNNPSWMNIKWSKPTAIHGLDLMGNEPPYGARFDKQAMAESFQRYWPSARDFLLTQPETSHLMTGLGLELPLKIDHKLWFLFILGAFQLYQRQPALLPQIMEALSPVFLARVLYFIEEAGSFDSRQVENFFENQCMIFEEHKKEFLN